VKVNFDKHQPVAGGAKIFGAALEPGKESSIGRFATAYVEHNDRIFSGFD